MMWLKKHIALCLMGLFIFPIVFQPLHILLRHSPNQVHHHCCAHKHCQSHSKPQHHNEAKFSLADTSCPICDYHFATKDVSNTSIARTAIPVFTYDYNAFATQQKYTQAYSNKSPRAPPVS